MIIYQLLYTLSCVPFAWLNARWIEKGKRILHAWNGLLHLVAAGVGWWLYSWEVALIILCNARVVFDTSLNLFRGLPWDYVPLNPKSITDKVERFLFGSNYWVPKLIYALTSIGLNILYYSK